MKRPSASYGTEPPEPTGATEGEDRTAQHIHTGKGDKNDRKTACRDSGEKIQRTDDKGC